MHALLNGQYRVAIAIQYIHADCQTIMFDYAIICMHASIMMHMHVMGFSITIAVGYSYHVAS